MSQCLQLALQSSSTAQHALTIFGAPVKKQMTAMGNKSSSGCDKSSLVCCRAIAEQLTLQVGIKAKVLYKVCTQSEAAENTWVPYAGYISALSHSGLMLLVHTNKLIPHSCFLTACSDKSC